MKYIFFIPLTIALMAITFKCNAQEIVKTKTGRTIILYPDHTWQYYEIQKKQSEPKKQSLPKKPGYSGTRQDTIDSKRINIDIAMILVKAN